MREQVRAYVESKKHVRLHHQFHHLNSSQAFALNLFVPYFEGGPSPSSLLLTAMGQTGMVATWDIEVIPDSTEETNIDVVWTLADETQTYCEVKLSERDFGTAEADARHLLKLRDTYAPVLRGHIDDSLLEPELFCKHYQILRNLWHVVQTNKSRVIFLLPRANERLWSILDNALTKISFRESDRVSVKAVEDVIEELCADPASPPELREHAEALRLKYLVR
jgi:hypothetical protein